MIYLLLVVYQLKHFLADYPLQGRYMLGKFKPFPACLLPLLSHGLVHGVFTFLIALYFKDWQVAAWLGALDMLIHSGVDYVKANPSLGGRFKALTKETYMMSHNMSQGLSMVDGSPMPKEISEKDLETYKELGRKDLKSNVYFWWALGADQLAHHLTHYLLIWIILS
ncbi:MAG: DUF3307 domain-containing protein [Leptolyngbyaceae cyanobacterium RM2_2_4]|nr:DUF3307 domain-containing protein [Leptolyngbyaceae cyanobacterium RM2_2_4]